MRFIRYAALVAAFAAVFFIGPAACSSNSDDSGGSPTGSTDTPVSSEADRPMSLPDAPAGKVTTAGDLCRLIPADEAARILGYEGPLTSGYTADELPAAAGIDACRYTDRTASKGITVLLSVRRGVTNEVWAQTESEFQAQKGIYELTDYKLSGVDSVLANSSQQVVVRKGEIMASGLNSSLGKFDQKSLVMLTALAASMAS